MNPTTRLVAIIAVFAGIILWFRLDTKQKVATAKGKAPIAKKKVTVVKAKFGLKYIVLKEGTGARPTKGKTVVVHYTGWLHKGTNKDGTPIKGKKFDSSRDRGKHFSFPLGQGRVIKGWDYGLSQMRIGDRRLLILPPHLGYGARGAGGVIPGNATLIFDVELVAIK